MDVYKGFTDIKLDDSPSFVTVGCVCHLLSSSDVTPHPDQVQAIKDMTPLHDVKGFSGAWACAIICHASPQTLQKL